MVARKVLQRDAGRIEEHLATCLPEVDPRARGLGPAMRHSVAGGKRIRGVLVMRSASTFGLAPQTVIPSACAFEMLHAATLVHDDLPCIDDSDLRRGGPSCHVAFDEHTALLAADALIVAAFENLARQARQAASARVLRVVEEFAAFTGAGGLIGGEQADIIAEELPPDLKLLRFIHVNKTAKLICAACRTGAILAGAPEAQLEIMSDYGMTLGLLFQITDDILDVVGDQTVLGKPTGADAAAGKQTYPGAIGLEGAREEARRLAAKAVEIAWRLPAEVEFWKSLARLVVERDR
ncbi:MAG: farnesyl diphosphate synthase [Armatimonadota bacterium]|nr:farnesyl diphosphate synthase [Armatimonadota bacterium]